MNLTFLFDKNGAGNPYFKDIYNTIFETFSIKIPGHNIKHLQPEGMYQSAPGGMSNFQIINDDNNKTILMSFWDRGMDAFQSNIGWEKYEIAQYIGGLGMTLNSEKIKETYGIEHHNFQYPLGVPNSYEYIDQVKSEYNPEDKIPKAIFIGAMYGTRIPLTEILSKHPLFEIMNNSSGYQGLEYFKKINEYRVSLSFNGNGEFCLRDLESMGLGIPCLRSELKTEFYNPLIQDYHYIRGGRPCSQAWFTYSDSKIEDVAQEYIESLEKVINDYDTLKKISKNSSGYFNMYCKPSYIIELFYKLINLDAIDN
jgi:hypothetical protein